MLIYQPRLVCRDEQKNSHSRPVLVLVLAVSTDGSCCALSLSSLIKAERSTSTCHVSLHSLSMLAWSPHSKHELYVGRVGPIVIFVSPLLVLHLASCSHTRRWKLSDHSGGPHTNQASASSEIGSPVRMVGPPPACQPSSGGTRVPVSLFTNQHYTLPYN